MAVEERKDTGEMSDETAALILREGRQSDYGKIISIIGKADADNNK